MAFSYFWDTEWVRGTARAGAFAAFCNWEEYWLTDYALFRALSDRFEGAPWTDWETDAALGDPETLELARKDLETEILFHQYMQWLADDQWETARERAAPVALFGDFPFMVSTDSADVWARQDLFRFDATVGVPPDAFSATGQDWGLPVYRWDAMADDDFKWLRDRVPAVLAAVRWLSHRSCRRLLPHVRALHRAEARIVSTRPTSPHSSRKASV